MGDGGGLSGMGMGGGMGGGMSGGAGIGGGPWKAFDGSLSGDILAEEFGPVAGAGGMGDTLGGFGGKGGGGFGSSMMGGGDGGMPSGSDMGDDRGMGAGNATTVTAENRYVDGSEDDLPYKTRGFHLHVKMRWEHIPRLLGPEQHVRFHSP